MATLTATAISRAGVTVTLAAATVGGDALTNTGKEYLEVLNSDSSSTTLTLHFNSTSTVDGQTATNRTVAVAASARKLIGPFPPSEYNDASGLVQITYSSVTALTIGAFKLTPETN